MWTNNMGIMERKTETKTVGLILPRKINLRIMQKKVETTRFRIWRDYVEILEKENGNWYITSNNTDIWEEWKRK